MKQRSSAEFDNFDRTMRNLMSVPHDEIKAAQARSGMWIIDRLTV
jgi:hypothetical protein